jgi:DNA-directed RNA polymerase subunit RPC12/RpoP
MQTQVGINAQQSCQFTVHQLLASTEMTDQNRLKRMAMQGDHQAACELVIHLRRSCKVYNSELFDPVLFWCGCDDCNDHCLQAGMCGKDIWSDRCSNCGKPLPGFFGAERKAMNFHCDRCVSRVKLWHANNRGTYEW